MAYQYVPARDMVVQVLQSDATTWTEVEGLDTVGLDPAAREQMTDKGTYGSGGYDEQVKMQLGAQIELSGFLMKDSVTGAQAPGQARCATLAAALAYAGLGQVRFRLSDVTDTVWTVWTEATFSLGAQTGDKNALRNFVCTIGRNGQPSTAAVT